MRMRMRTVTIKQSQSALENNMTPSDLRAWQAAMGYTQSEAAQALGISRSCYSDLFAGRRRTTGTIIEQLSRRTKLACGALADAHLKKTQKTSKRKAFFGAGYDAAEKNRRRHHPGVKADVSSIDKVSRLDR